MARRPGKVRALRMRSLHAMGSSCDKRLPFDMGLNGGAYRPGVVVIVELELESIVASFSAVVAGVVSQQNAALPDAITAPAQPGGGGLTSLNGCLRSANHRPRTSPHITGQLTGRLEGMIHVTPIHRTKAITKNSLVET